MRTPILLSFVLIVAACHHGGSSPSKPKNPNKVVLETSMTLPQTPFPMISARYTTKKGTPTFGTFMFNSTPPDALHLVQSDYDGWVDFILDSTYFGPWEVQAQDEFGENMTDVAEVDVLPYEYALFASSTILDPNTSLEIEGWAVSGNGFYFMPESGSADLWGFDSVVGEWMPVVADIPVPSMLDLSGVDFSGFEREAGFLLIGESSLTNATSAVIEMNLPDLNLGGWGVNVSQSGENIEIGNGMMARKGDPFHFELESLNGWMHGSAFATALHVESGESVTLALAAGQNGFDWEDWPQSTAAGLTGHFRIGFEIDGEQVNFNLFRLEP
ncbi:MAG: hypothetical protein H6619_00300 [Deltaproteobacteria bacterium]|nr:hypothetical protein [Deltaproteobacteria bacterium]